MVSQFPNSTTAFAVEPWFSTTAFLSSSTNQKTFAFHRRLSNNEGYCCSPSSTSSSSSTQLSLSSVGEACGLTYNEPVFRPPAEWRSLILQVTEGCSWNHCTFCEMYQDKTFRSKSIEQIEQELQQVVDMGGAPYVRDVFLADGDAMTLPTKQLATICDKIQQYFPKVRRISSYCLPRNIRYKSVEELQLLQQKGLSLVYVGCESGNNQVLEAVQKGETYETSLDALMKLKQAGIKRSVMILLGLGGTMLSQDHAIDSAKLCTAAEPEFLSVLVTSFPRGKQRIEQGYLDMNNGNNQGDDSATTKTTATKNSESSSTAGGSERSSTMETKFEELSSPRDILKELELFLSNVNIPASAGKTIFRSDHASNYLVLKGRLGRDKEKILCQLRDVLNAPEEEDPYNLRPEWARGL